MKHMSRVLHFASVLLATTALLLEFWPEGE